jgi:hypothetical protein
MQYPEALLPTTYEDLRLPSGTIVKAPKVVIEFNPWLGKNITGTYGGKPILNYKWKPAFAELVVLKLFQDNGWDGVWVDAFRNKFRTEYWPRNEVELPERQFALMRRISEQAGSGKGCWDVFCWKEDTLIFSEVKHQGHDRIRQTQLKWIDSAIKCGLKQTSFLIVEWSETSDKNTPA